MDGCIPQTGDQDVLTGFYETYTFSATGAVVRKYSNNACQGIPDETIESTYDEMEFNQCQPNDRDEDKKSSRQVTKFLLVPTTFPTRAPTYKNGAPTPIPTPAPTRQKFPYVLTENFVSTDCSGPAKEAHIDVSGVCDISFDYNPSNDEKTQNPGSYKISGEGAHRYKESFSDDKCTISNGKRSDGPLGLCMQITNYGPDNQITNSGPNNQIKSAKFTGITNLNDLFNKYPGYLVYSDYLDNDCNGGLHSLTLQDPSKTCSPNDSGMGAAFYKASCNATTLFSEKYSDDTCTSRLSRFPYKPSCRNKTPGEIYSVAKSSKESCSTLPPGPIFPTIAPTR